MKICGLGDEVLHAEGERDNQTDGQRGEQTDGHDKPNNRFSQFREKRPKNRERVRSAVSLC